MVPYITRQPNSAFEPIRCFDLLKSLSGTYTGRFWHSKNIELCWCVLHISEKSAFELEIAECYISLLN